MNASDRFVANWLAKSFDFSIKLRDNKEPFNLQLKSTLTTIESLKFKIEDMYAFKYCKQIKIEKIAYYESYITLEGDSVGYDDATKKYIWKELGTDDNVESMFHSVEGDPAPLLEQN
ncbi:hypothetical protein A2U01_0037860 [Trifolium medium]|uniref:Uncharacterized protein n=1 Tax=Trifolium medium TaxID=97028 RepID=A0A392PZG4_9FABA|nr:hypothetical protein [Trifolium medium]